MCVCVWQLKRQKSYTAVMSVWANAVPHKQLDRLATAKGVGKDLLACYKFGVDLTVKLSSCFSKEPF